MEAKRPKKKEKERKNDKKEEDLDQATSGVSTTQEADPLRESLGDPEKDMDDLEDTEKDVGNLEDRTSHSQVYLKKRKIRQMFCQN